MWPFLMVSNILDASFWELPRPVMDDLFVLVLQLCKYMSASFSSFQLMQLPISYHYLTVHKSFLVLNGIQIFCLDCALSRRHFFFHFTITEIISRRFVIDVSQGDRLQNLKKKTKIKRLQKRSGLRNKTMQFFCEL